MLVVGIVSRDAMINERTVMDSAIVVPLAEQDRINIDYNGLEGLFEESKQNSNFNFVIIFRPFIAKLKC